MKGIIVTRIVRLAIAGAALAAMAQFKPAFAQHASAPPEHHCMDLAAMKSLAATNEAKWIDLMHDQYNFLRGVSAASPATPEGIPYGANAALARKGDKSMVVFVDGDRACDIMPAPQALVDMLNDVGEVRHEPVAGQDQ